MPYDKISGRHDPASHPLYIGRQAVVVGAGIGGLATAGALASYFEHVLVLERDSLSTLCAPRPGASQGWHAHGLLVGGQLALADIYPGIGDDFCQAGAVPVRINQDLREERPELGIMPQRDFGMLGYTMSRPLIESSLRRRALQRPNVTIRQNTQVIGVETDASGGRVTSVRYARTSDDTVETLPADLVVDASGRGQLTIDTLQAIGHGRPRESAIGVDLCYTTAILPIPADAPTDWKIVLTHPNPPDLGRRAVMLQIEGNRWILSVVGRGQERPPAEWSAMLKYLQGFTTDTIYQTVKRIEPIGRLARFLLPESVWRHFEELDNLPDGLLPIGDSICRFNPVYGQGMSVAAKEAVLLRNLLGERASESDPLRGLAREFLTEAKPVIETPWSMAAIPDFAYPDTRGDRPADLQQKLQFSDALARLCMRDEAVQRLAIEVWHMLKPYSALQDADLVRRVEEEMADA
jgi:2-polyprenyl-6-methoxyphenol hydroxylase-like FAD-dependent oxidoreductase